MHTRIRPLATLILFAALLAATLPSPVSAQPGGDFEPRKRQILFLNSYQNGYSWSDHLLEGVRRGFKGAPFDIDLQVEYLDAKKHPGADKAMLLAELMASKFNQVTLDAIIVSDNDAYEFMLAHQPWLFPGVPVVFCGVNDFKPEQIAGRPFTGLVENPDVAATLEVAARLHPDRSRCVVISDQDTTSRAIVAQFRKAMPRFANRFTFEFWDTIALSSLSDRVASLNDDAIVYQVPFYLEVNGTSYSPEELAALIARHTRAPVYSSWEFLLGSGLMGGKMLSGVRHGEAAAQRVIQILGGTRPEDIPVSFEPQDEFIFDWQVLQRFLISTRLLPENSRFINEPAPFYELQKPVFWTIIASLLLMSVILIQLVMANAKRRTAEGQLKEQLGFMRLLLDAIPQLVYWKDIKGRYMGANKSFTDFFGLGDVRSVIGLTNHDLMDIDDHAQRGDDADQSVLVSGLPQHRLTWEMERPDGSAAVLEIAKVPLTDLRGQIVGVLSTAEDITGRISLERQLIQSQKMEALGTFVSGIAHDFNNILTTVINSAELALLDLPKDAEADQDVRRALRAAQRGSRLVSQMHTYSRPSREGFKPVDIALAVREALNLLRASLPGNIRLVEAIEDGPATALANPTQINQVVMNLCTNAFQAMRETGGILTVGLSRLRIEDAAPDAPSLPPGSYLSLVVVDTGPGISPAIRDKIFDPFFTTKDKGEGTGLGLAVVQGIVAAHKGAIILRGEPGQGARFEVWLPCADCAAVASSETETALPPREGSEHILFVEDNPDQLQVLPKALERLGYVVTPARDALEALDALARGERPFDVVVTDYDMPEIDGVEFARNLFQVAPGLPVIMVSGRRGAAAAAVRAPSIRRVLHKPYSAAELSRAVGEVLDEAGANLEGRQP